MAIGVYSLWRKDRKYLPRILISYHEGGACTLLSGPYLYYLPPIVSRSFAIGVDSE